MKKDIEDANIPNLGLSVDCPNCSTKINTDCNIFDIRELFSCNKCHKKVAYHTEVSKQIRETGFGLKNHILADKIEVDTVKVKLGKSNKVIFKSKFVKIVDFLYRSSFNYIQNEINKEKNKERNECLMVFIQNIGSEMHHRRENEDDIIETTPINIEYHWLYWGGVTFVTAINENIPKNHAINLIQDGGDIEVEITYWVWGTLKEKTIPFWQELFLESIEYVNNKNYDMALVILYSSFEAFLDMILREKLLLYQSNGKSFSEDFIERSFIRKEINFKLTKLFKNIFGKSISDINNDLYQKLLNIRDLRNNIAHKGERNIEMKIFFVSLADIYELIMEINYFLIKGNQK